MSCPKSNIQKGLLSILLWYKPFLPYSMNYFYEEHFLVWKCVNFPGWLRFMHRKQEEWICNNTALLQDQLHRSNNPKAAAASLPRIHFFFEDCQSLLSLLSSTAEPLLLSSLEANFSCLLLLTSLFATISRKSGKRTRLASANFEENGKNGINFLKKFIKVFWERWKKRSKRNSRKERKVKT